MPVSKTKDEHILHVFFLFFRFGSFTFCGECCSNDDEDIEQGEIMNNDLRCAYIIDSHWRSYYSMWIHFNFPVSKSRQRFLFPANKRFKEFAKKCGEPAGPIVIRVAELLESKGLEEIEVTPYSIRIEKAILFREIPEHDVLEIVVSELPEDVRSCLEVRSKGIPFDNPHILDKIFSR